MGTNEICEQSRGTVALCPPFNLGPQFRRIFKNFFASVLPRAVLGNYGDLLSLFPGPSPCCPWVGIACADTLSEHSTDPSLPHGSGGSAEKGQLTEVTAHRGSQVGDLVATAEAGLTFEWNHSQDLTEKQAKGASCRATELLSCGVATL